MSEHEHHEHQKHEHHQQHGHHEQGRPNKLAGLHKDWRTWVVVGLMLAGMFMYVYTMDEADPPGSTAPGMRMPAEAPAE